MISRRYEEQHGLCVLRSDKWIETLGISVDMINFLKMLFQFCLRCLQGFQHKSSSWKTGCKHITTPKGLPTIHQLVSGYLNNFAWFLDCTPCIVGPHCLHRIFCLCDQWSLWFLVCFGLVYRNKVPTRNHSLSAWTAPFPLKVCYQKLLFTTLEKPSRPGLCLSICRAPKRKPVGLSRSVLEFLLSVDFDWHSAMKKTPLSSFEKHQIFMVNLGKWCFFPKFKKTCSSQIWKMGTASTLHPGALANHSSA